MSVHEASRATWLVAHTGHILVLIASQEADAQVLGFGVGSDTPAWGSV